MVQKLALNCQIISEKLIEINSVMKTKSLIAAITLTALTIIIFSSCETEECPICTECDSTQVAELTEWGETVKNEIISLTFLVDDMASVRIYNADESIQYWSGFGTPGEGSPNLMWQPMSSSMSCTYELFNSGDWNISTIDIPYNDVIGVVLQYVTFVSAQGAVERFANNLLVFMSNDYNPEENTDGVSAKALPRNNEVVKGEDLLLSK